MQVRPVWTALGSLAAAVALAIAVASPAGAEDSQSGDGQTGAAS